MVWDIGSMFNKLRYRVSLIFILFSLSIIFLANIVNHYCIEKKFNIYTSEKYNSRKWKSKIKYQMHTVIIHGIKSY